MQASELKSLADAPGTSREYETIYIVRPNTTNDGVAEINDRIRNIIEGMGGKVIKVDNWGKRRLAYEVRKERKGIYLYWQYLATQGVVQELERNMRMLDSVIRYMTVKLDKDVDPEARPSEVDEETYERASNTAADEEDMYLRSAEEGEEAAPAESSESEGKAEKSEDKAEASAADSSATDSGAAGSGAASSDSKESAEDAAPEQSETSSNTEEE